MDADQEQRFRFRLRLEQEQAQEKLSQQSPDYKQVVGSAVKNAFMQPGTITRNLATDPITQAQALPALAGTVGGLSPVPGGAFLGTRYGRELSNLALKAYGRPELVPSAGQQALESVLAAAGDVIALPMAKKAYFGKQIGKIEQARGVPPPQDIPSIPMPTGTKSISEFIDGAVDSVKGSQGRGSAVYWKQIKDQVDRIYESGKQLGLTANDRLKLRWLNNQVQTGLNKAVLGRELPAKALAMSQTIPNAIGNAYNAIPMPIKKILGGSALGGSTAAGWKLISQLLGK